MSDRDMLENQITGKIVGCAIRVHKELGPGLLESTYESAMMVELKWEGYVCENQVKIPIRYRGMILPQHYFIDVLVENIVIVELKSIEKVLPVHLKQLQTYLKLSNRKVGLLLNFNVAYMKEGIFRAVNNL